MCSNGSKPWYGTPLLEDVGLMVIKVTWCEVVQVVVAEGR